MDKTFYTDTSHCELKSNVIHKHIDPLTFVATRPLSVFCPHRSAFYVCTLKRSFFLLHNPWVKSGLKV